MCHCACDRAWVTVTHLIARLTFKDAAGLGVPLSTGPSAILFDVWFNFTPIFIYFYILLCLFTSNWYIINVLTTYSHVCTYTFCCVYLIKINQSMNCLRYLHLTALKDMSVNTVPATHEMDTSSLCPQLCCATPLCLHWPMSNSEPTHSKSSSQISPSPGPNSWPSDRPTCLYTTQQWRPAVMHVWLRQQLTRSMISLVCLVIRN